MAPFFSQTELGNQGETLVAQWLMAQGWQIQAQQWHSRWGELDLVASRGSGPTATLAFVEVKTRSQGSWDADGLMAITRRKQAKLGKTARLYLGQHPQWAEVACRFDVALVACRRQPDGSTSNSDWGDYARALDPHHWLVLQEYIPHAFTVD